MEPSSSLPLRLLLLGLVAMWNATQAATTSVPREKRFANVEIAGIYLFDQIQGGIEEISSDAE